MSLDIDIGNPVPKPEISSVSINDVPTSCSFYLQIASGVVEDDSIGDIGGKKDTKTQLWHWVFNHLSLLYLTHYGGGGGGGG